MREGVAVREAVGVFGATRLEVQVGLGVLVLSAVEVLVLSAVEVLVLSAVEVLVLSAVEVRVNVRVGVKVGGGGSPVTLK